MSKTTAKFCEKSRNKHHSNGLMGVCYHVYNCTVTVSYSNGFFLVFVFPADLLYWARLCVICITCKFVEKKIRGEVKNR